MSSLHCAFLPVLVLGPWAPPSSRLDWDCAGLSAQTRHARVQLRHPWDGIYFQTTTPIVFETLSLTCGTLPSQVHACGPSHHNRPDQALLAIHPRIRVPWETLIRRSHPASGIVCYLVCLARANHPNGKGYPTPPSSCCPHTQRPISFYSCHGH